MFPAATSGGQPSPRAPSQLESLGGRWPPSWSPSPGPSPQNWERGLWSQPGSNPPYTRPAGVCGRDIHAGPGGLGTCVHPRDSPGSGLLGGQGRRERWSARDEKQPHVMGTQGGSGQSWPGPPLDLMSQPPARNLSSLSAGAASVLGCSACPPPPVLGEGEALPEENLSGALGMSGPFPIVPVLLCVHPRATRPGSVPALEGGQPLGTRRGGRLGDRGGHGRERCLLTWWRWGPAVPSPLPCRQRSRGCR